MSQETATVHHAALQTHHNPSYSVMSREREVAHVHRHPCDPVLVDHRTCGHHLGRLGLGHVCALCRRLLMVAAVLVRLPADLLLTALVFVVAVGTLQPPLKGLGGCVGAFVVMNRCASQRVHFYDVAASLTPADAACANTAALRGSCCSPKVTPSALYRCPSNGH